MTIDTNEIRTWLDSTKKSIQGTLARGDYYAVDGKKYHGQLEAIEHMLDWLKDKETGNGY